MNEISFVRKLIECDIEICAFSHQYLLSYMWLELNDEIQLITPNCKYGIICIALS